MLSSLRAKITLGYYLVGLLFLGMAGVAFLELRLVQDKIKAGAVIAEFLEVSLEVRRFEKNYFLYDKGEDLAEQAGYLARAHELLGQHAEAFAEFGGSARIAELNAGIARYRQNMAAYAELAGSAERTSRRPALETLIRQDGKRVVDFAEDAARRERAMLQASLDSHRRNLLLSIGVLVLLILPVGQIVAWRIARPLKNMERHMERVARGDREPLQLDSTDRELVSLNQAFNHMLAELDLRQKHMVRSEKLASLGTLLSGVAHELNNPLSNISTTAQILIEDHADTDPATLKRMLEQIDEQTERARRIVRALLDFARDQPIRTEPVALRELVGQTLDFLKGGIPGNVRVLVDIDPALNACCDRQRLQQVLLNLVKNAADALAQGSSRRDKAAADIAPAAMHGKGEIRIEARKCSMLLPGLAAGHAIEPDPGVEIEVIDNGPGIPPAILARIFDPFFTTKEVGRGAGLGLFIANEIIEEHGGALSVDSRPGEGTRFRILLPDTPRTAP